MSNRIGNISNSQIEKIEQQVQYNTVLSEEIREAILLITALMKEDIDWKRTERGNLAWERVVAEKRNYAFSVFDKSFRIMLTLILLLGLYPLWIQILSPLFSFFIENGVSARNIGRAGQWVFQQFSTSQGMIIRVFTILVGYLICSAFIALIVARWCAKRKYKPEFAAVAKKFGL